MLRVRRVAILAAVAVAYAVAARLGLIVAFLHPSATPVWAPTGIALAALLLLGYEAAAAVLLGAFVVNVATTGSVGISFGIALGNTLEALCGVYLVNRYADGRYVFERARHIVRFAVLAAVLSTTISATIGVTSLALGGAARWTEFGAIWLTWWLGDMGGALVVAPVLVLWATDARIRWTGSRAIEALALLAGLVVVSQLVFGAPIATVRHDLPVEFACVPFVMWAAYRFGRREVATAVVLLAGLAVWGTLRQAGPFARDSANESLLLVQSFLMIVSLTGLMLASLVAETRSAQNQLRQLVFTDPLTGLGNYRNLVSALELEIERFHRTGRRFSFVLFDLDRLKRINDRYGHAVGSRALCRLADAISDCCRGIDHAARLGGDEFALVLPDTTAEDAWAVAARVAARLAGDGEVPAVSATAGIAVYPDDGETTELLFETADRVLYKGKRGRYARATVGFRDLPQ